MTPADPAAWLAIAVLWLALAALIVLFVRAAAHALDVDDLDTHGMADAFRDLANHHH